MRIFTKKLNRSFKSDFLVFHNGEVTFSLNTTVAPLDQNRGGNYFG